MMVIIVVPRTPAVMPFPARAWANRICATFDIGHILQDRPNRTAAAFDHLNDGSEHHPSTGLIFSCGGFGRQQSGKQLFHNDFSPCGFFPQRRRPPEIFTRSAAESPHLPKPGGLGPGEAGWEGEGMG